MRPQIAVDALLVPADTASYLFEKLGRPAYFLETTGLAGDEFPEMISVRTHLTMLGNAMRSSDRGKFVRYYLDTVSIHSAKYLAIGLQCAPTIGEGFDLIERYGGERSLMFSCSFAISDDRATFTVNPRTDLGLGTLPMVEGFVSYIGKFLLAVTREAGIAPVAFVRHAYDPGCSITMPFPVHYSQDRIAIEFPAHWASMKSEAADPDLWRLINWRCEAQRSEVERDNAVAAVERNLTDLWRSLNRMPLLKEFAKHSNTSSRSVIRQLQRHGLRYRDLTDTIQKRRAVEMMGSAALSIEDVAHTLGFSDASSFRRSFHRWFEMSPSEWRKTHLPVHPQTMARSPHVQKHGSD